MEKNALISVFNKDGIDEFVKRLVKLGYRIISSGGTAKFLKEKGVAVTDVAEITGMPAILDHHVVTLHPKVHGGLLAKKTPEHDAEREKHGIPLFDLVCVDLYPLERTLEGSDEAKIIEMVDIGGPTMISSAAKGRRIVIADRADRESVLQWLESGKPEEEAMLRRLAAKADYMVSRYRLLSARYFGQGNFDGIIGERAASPFKGENAAQTPAHLYDTRTGDPLALPGFMQIEGAPLSYNNYADLDRLLQTGTHIAAAWKHNFGSIPAIALGVKHGNACGAAVDDDPAGAAQKMIEGDAVAIFGGSILINREVNGAIAEALTRHKTDGGPKRILDSVIAPAFAPEAIEILSRKSGKCRLIVNEALKDEGLAALDTATRFRYVRGGFLTQANYAYVLDWNDPAMQYPAGNVSADAKRDLLLAWAIGCTSNSNTIVLAKEGKLLGNAVGQQSRVAVASLAVLRATDSGHALAGASAYSDSFFPFVDGPEVRQCRYFVASHDQRFGQGRRSHQLSQSKKCCACDGPRRKSPRLFRPLKLHRHDLVEF